MARVATWAAQEGRAVGRIVTEIGSALSGKRRQLLALLREATVTTIVVEHRDTASRGSELVEADRCFASSRTCHGCGLVQDLGWAERWRGDGGGARHRRDDHAASNLARHRSPGAPHPAGLVGAPPVGSGGAF